MSGEDRGQGDRGPPNGAQREMQDHVFGAAPHRQRGDGPLLVADRRCLRSRRRCANGRAAVERRSRKRAGSRVISRDDRRNDRRCHGGATRSAEVSMWDRGVDRLVPDQPGTGRDDCSGRQRYRARGGRPRLQRHEERHQGVGLRGDEGFGVGQGRLGDDPGQLIPGARRQEDGNRRCRLQARRTALPAAGERLSAPAEEDRSRDAGPGDDARGDERRRRPALLRARRRHGLVLRQPRTTGVSRGHSSARRRRSRRGSRRPEEGSLADRGGRLRPDGPKRGRRGGVGRRARRGLPCRGRSAQRLVARRLLAQGTRSSTARARAGAASRPWQRAVACRLAHRRERRLVDNLRPRNHVPHRLQFRGLRGAHDPRQGRRAALVQVQRLYHLHPGAGRGGPVRVRGDGADTAGHGAVQADRAACRARRRRRRAPAGERRDGARDPRATRRGRRRPVSLRGRGAQ